MKRFKRLLAAVNPNWLPGPGGGDAQPELLSMLQGVNRLLDESGGEVSLIAVLPEGTAPDDVAAAEARIRDHVVPALRGTVAGVTVAQGRPFYEIVRKVVRDGHDLVTLTARHPRSGVAIVGSTATQVIRKCPCPVWVAWRDSRPIGPRTVLSAVALFHGPSKKVLELSASIVAWRGGEWHVMHVPEYVHEGAMRLRGAPAQEIQAYEKECRERSFAKLHEMVDPLAKEAGVQPKLWMAEGHPHEQIAQAERTLDADLVVMGTIGRGGLAGMLIGNTAERTLALVESSLLAVKPPDFVCPIPA